MSVLHVAPEIDPVKGVGQLAYWVKENIEEGVVILLGHEGRSSIGNVQIVGAGLPPKIPTSDVVEEAFLEVFTALAELPYKLDPSGIEAVEGHEWRGALLAYILSKRLGKTFRYSLYSTEEERGGSGVIAEAVKSIEYFLQKEADVVIHRRKGFAVEKPKSREQLCGLSKPEGFNVVHVSWEWPPHVIGGLGRAVTSIARRMARRVNVYILTIGLPGHVFDETENKLRVLRVDPFLLRSTGLVSWVYAFNMLMIAKALTSIPRPDIIHVHDWLGAPAGVSLKHILRIPLIATMHATEYGRSRGRIWSPMQHQIHYWEWRLTYEAWRVFVCSKSMRDEVTAAFSLPSDKVSVLPNGIDLAEIDARTPSAEERSRYALPWEKIVFFAGRHVYDKGVDVLVNAARMVLSKRDDVKFVVAGDGPMRAQLMDLARYFGLGEKILFTGRLSDDELYKVMKIADVVAIPSRYEPFGIVALEAMAAAKPIVASKVGGLSELVVDNETGIVVPPEDSPALAEAIERVLNDPRSQEMGYRGRRRVEELYRWGQIISHLLATYERVLEEYIVCGWKTLF
ncbi:MAG: glycosyltransferase family 4 protein [Thermofilaceae archaeon]